ncbi:scavenger receptor cysteine-rich type 1 protein M130 isoform X1 [Alosa pseudoharengus]|uniref:scavenger receptor cysteine-rich type 1 protein M130 isoform X1 n=1 Tax=Alosa pseudoharengus TaxID=34774 RepID=UPI003F8B94B8
MMIFLLYLHIQTIHGQNKLILSGGSNACEGRVDVYHQGKWGHVGPINWHIENSNVVCRSLNCGTALETTFGFKDDRHLTQQVWADDIKCEGTEKHLWDCPSPTWGIVKSRHLQHVYIKCSDKPEPSLVLKGRTGCAGFVRLNTTKDNHIYLCSGDWEKHQDHAEQLCKTLSCGQATQSPVSQGFKETGKIQPYNCLRNDLSLWQCVDWTSARCVTPASVTCSKHLFFRLKGNAKVNLCSGSLEVYKDTTWQTVSSKDYRNISQHWSPNDICNQVNCRESLTEPNETSSNVYLNCSEQVSISLKDAGQQSHCYGVVYLKKKKSEEAVCVNSEMIGHLVCRELGCGDFMFTSNKGSFQPAQWTGMSCENHAESLWHCQSDNCNKKNTAIICSESIDVRLSNGLDKCSGRVEIYYKGAWKRVRANDWKRVHSDIVCAHLQCGKGYKEGHDLFVDGDTLDTLELSLKAQCQSDDPIHKCLEENGRSNSQDKFIKVVCQDSQMFFVEKKSSCSGMVGVEQAGKSYSLSGQPGVWNDSAAEHVCQKMQCGHMANYSTSVNHTASDWMQLDCPVSSDNCTLRPVISITTEAAEVTCTDEVTLKLTNDNKDLEKSKRRCWGEVNVCHGDACHGVCGDVWSEKHSEMLCQDLGCGRPVTNLERKSPNTLQATVSSVHCPSKVSDLSRCRFVMNATCKVSTIYVVCSGSLKSKLSDPRDKCGGKMEAFLAGSWQPVCGDVNVMKTICTETGCGGVITPTAADIMTNSKAKVIKCDQAFQSLVNCTVTKEPCDKQRIPRVRCSGWSRPVVVGKSACSGGVFVKTEAPERLHAMSSTGWGDRESRALCKSLDCGDLVTNSSGPTVSFQNWWNKTYNCNDGDQSIWNCEEKHLPVEKQQLNISCQEHRFINLTDLCYGEVIISGKSRERVCKTGWTEFMSRILCQHLECGNPVDTDYAASPLTGEAHHFSCTGAEINPLQCKAEKGQCDSGPASVVCSKSLNFNLTDQCGGEIQVLYGGELKPACLKKGNTPSLLCNQVKGCGNVNSSKKSLPRRGQRKDHLPFSCDLDKDLEYCMRLSSCEKDDLTELYCDGFKEITPPPELPINLIVGVSVGLLLLVIAIALVMWQRRRILYRLRGRRAFSQTRSTLASDNFEDIELNVKEERDMGLKSQANGQGKGLDSQASSEYDDVDEEADAGFNSADEAPPLPDRPALGGELDNGDDYTDGYDDVDQLPLEEEEDPEEPGVPPQPEESSVPVPLDEEDYVQPDDDK